MKLYLPYLQPYGAKETVDFAIAHQGRIIVLNTDPIFGYWKLFQKIWKEGEPFLILEHDIVPTDDQYNEIVDCDRPWCVFHYDVNGTTCAALGFSKFEPERLGIPLPLMGDLHYQDVGNVVWNTLHTTDWRPHQHPGWVRHLRGLRGNETYNHDTDGIFVRSEG